MRNSASVPAWAIICGLLASLIGAVVGNGIVSAAVAGSTALTGRILLATSLAFMAGLTFTGACYVVASKADANGTLGRTMRSLMIGFNAGMNTILAAAVFGSAIGVIVGAINLLAVVEQVSRRPWYQAVLGWASWVMPFSWGASGAGLLMLLINGAAWAVTLGRWQHAKIDGLAVDWSTGSVVMLGGLIRGPTAFDMGNFVFLNPRYVNGSTPDCTYEAVLRHETGHTLAVAAFGTVFGIADIINENLLGAGARDYGERVAESHANRAGRPTIPMWG